MSGFGGLPAPHKPQLTQICPPASHSEVLLGQAVFAPDGQGLFLTGYDTLADGKRLGIIYCTSRPAAIYYVSLFSLSSDDSTSEHDQLLLADAQFARVSARGRSARSPRVFNPPSTSGSDPCVIFLSNEEGGAHDDCASLHVLELPPTGGNPDSSLTRTVVPTQTRPDAKTGWPGLFVGQLPARPFVSASTSSGKAARWIATSTIWASRYAPVLINLDASDGAGAEAIRPLAPGVDVTSSPASRNGPDETALEGGMKLEAQHRAWSYKILSTDGRGLVLASRSRPEVPHQLVVARAAAFEHGEIEGERLRWDVLLRADETIGEDEEAELGE